MMDGWGADGRLIKWMDGKQMDRWMLGWIASRPWLVGKVDGWMGEWVNP